MDSSRYSKSRPQSLCYVEGSHPSLRKLAITPAIADEIVRLTKVQMKPSQILSSLRLGQTDDINDNNPLFKRQDIYNAKAEIRHKALGRLTPIQALMQELNRPHWYVRRRCNVYILNCSRNSFYLKDNLDRITHLYFSKDPVKAP